MRRKTLLIVLFLCLIPPGIARTEPPQMRGIWMHATQIKTPVEADALVAKIDRAHLNAVFILVWYWGGQAYFQSDFYPMGDGVQKNYDPLGYMVTHCHKRGIEVHAWFVNGSYGDSQPKYVLDTHPDWAVEDGGGGQLWYDFGKPQVRKFQSDLMIECLKKYDIDGLHFDYIRYGPRMCYCDHCQNEFAQRYGFEPMVGKRRTSFPSFTGIAGNTLKDPTTAVVLAEFADDTLPAIALNQLGTGRILLLNWHAESDMSPAVAEAVKRFLKKWTSKGANVYITNTAANRAQYGNRYLGTAVRALAHLGYKTTTVGENRIDKLPTGSVLVLPAVYIIPEETARKLESFVNVGGKLLIIDGPVTSMKLPAMQRITGFAAAGPYIYRDDMIRSTGRDPFVPKGEHHFNLERIKLRAEKWAEYRKAGVTSLVQDVYHRAKKIKPNAQITAAVFTPLKSANTVFQDWPGWLRRDCIDYVIPMAYTTDTQKLEKQIKEWQTVDPRLDRIIPGLSIYEKTGGKSVTRHLDLIRKQVQKCRRYTPHGNLFFALPYLNDSLVELCRTEFYPVKVKSYRPVDR